MNHFKPDNNRQYLPDETFREHLDGSEKVILLLIDGFGYTSWLKHHQKTNILKKISENGSVTPLTSVFPSTTAASINTLCSGLTPQEHGLPEWFVYFKEIDMTLQSLPLQPVNGIENGDFDIDKVDPGILFKDETIFEKLGKTGVTSYSLLSEAYVNSPYSILSLHGSRRRPYENLEDLFTKLRTILEEEKRPVFIYAYIDSLDAAGHEYGPSSKEYADEINKIDSAIQNQLFSKLSMGTASETSLIITADHGQIDIPPKNIVYLNNLSGFQSMLRESPNMGYIAPTGAPRDVYLHVKEDKVDDCFRFLTDELDGVADVFRMKDAVDLGLFGLGKPCDEFLDRVGDLLVLPRGDGMVWFQVFPGKLFEMPGMHGGLSKEEMLIPLGVSKLSEIHF
jgi:predicted AlkP superfamily pyrophosphatase or phosphodiesterase